MRKVLIMNKDDPDSIKITKEVTDEFYKYGVNVLSEDYIDTVYADDVDLVIVIGGDGSILRALRNFDNDIPVLGINTGSVGYLSEIQPSMIKSTIRRLMDRDYRVEYLTQIQAIYNHNKSLSALNDINIYPLMATSMLKAKIYINGTFINDVQADSIIVATPTGSTAYSLSAGGSILTNDSNALIITAVAPYKPFNPIVVNNNSKIEIEIIREFNESIIRVDGAMWMMMNPHERVLIQKTNPKPFIRLGYTSFYEKLRGRNK